MGRRHLRCKSTGNTSEWRCPNKCFSTLLRLRLLILKRSEEIGQCCSSFVRRPNPPWRTERRSCRGVGFGSTRRGRRRRRTHGNTRRRRRITRIWRAQGVRTDDGRFEPRGGDSVGGRASVHRHRCRWCGQGTFPCWNSTGWRFKPIVSGDHYWLNQNAKCKMNKKSINQLSCPTIAGCFS